jgi:hypothetical protein
MRGLATNYMGASHQECNNDYGHYIAQDKHRNYGFIIKKYWIINLKLTDFTKTNEVLLKSASHLFLTAGN